MTDLRFTNARLVLADDIVTGSLAIADGQIAAIDAGAGAVGEDLDGDYLLPGLVELHTDHYENHYRPRPLVFWDPRAALQAHDVQIAGSGITTVFDALRIGSDPETADMDTHTAKMLAAIESATAGDELRADHFVHLRCELPSADVVDHFEQFCAHDLVRLASVMDHTPGQRQFQSVAHYAAYYQPRLRLSDAELATFIADRHAEQARYSDANRRAIFSLGHAAGLAFASHDDATVTHVAESLRDDVRIAEFPTTLEAAKASHQGGLAVLMGAPNVVRGQSHSGNISATDLARSGWLDVLSSDYVPSALLQAAFVLAAAIDTISLPDAVRTVSLNPARAAGLSDRGEIAIGKRADLVRVRLIGGLPLVRAVYRQGRRVA